MFDKIRYHKRSETWYDRYKETIWIGFEEFFFMGSALLAFYWFNSGGVKLSIVMTINTILGFIRVIQRSMRLEAKV